MFRNQYDTDVTTWSPQGRLFQVEYAMEAVKQGSCTVGVVGKEHAVLATLNRTQSELSSTIKKIFKCDDHMGIAVSGVTADGRIMCKFIRGECLNHRFVFESSLPVGRLVRTVADKNQVCTQRSWTRPYGVGLLVVGVDSSGPQLYQTCPSGQFWKYKAMAIGARSQAAKTYLERKLDEFLGSSQEELMMHALFALQASQQDGDITTENVTIAVVGKDQPFTLLEGDALAPFVARLENEGDQAAAAEGGDGVAPMDI
eukprot:jgi/Ulvmu1/7059/UM033_0119.1